MSHNRALPEGSQTAPDQPGTTDVGHFRGDEASGLTFPCENCGADLVFHIGQQSLTCPYCGFAKEISLGEGAKVAEQDFQATLDRLVRQRRAGEAEEIGDQAVDCRECGATVVFAGTLTSTECAYCGTPLQRPEVHTLEERIPVDGVLPFRVETGRAHQQLKSWVKSRWFAPTQFKVQGVQGRFQGVYLPCWTFDSLTFTRYSGMRGETYFVTVGHGKNRRRVPKIRWYPASGSFQRFFDDVLVWAGSGLSDKLLKALEPWPLEGVIPFTPDVLAGFQARTYDLPLDQGLTRARAEMESAIRAEVRARIGGDQQQIHHLDSRYDAITYKHLLMPIWMLSYRHGERVFQVVVNATTGEVQGERPYSAIKIFLFLATIALIILIFVVLGN